MRNTGDDVLGPDEVWTYSCVVDGPGRAPDRQLRQRRRGVRAERPARAERASWCDSDTKPVTPAGHATGQEAAGHQAAGLTPPPGSGSCPRRSSPAGRACAARAGASSKAFRARVSGRAIRSVAFFVDGKLVKQINKSKSAYNVKIRPNKYGFGRHRVIARVRFTTESGTSTRRLPLTFRRCGAARWLRASPAEPRQQPSPTVPAAPPRGAAGSLRPRPSDLHPPARCESGCSGNTERADAAAGGRGAAEAEEEERHG